MTKKRKIKVPAAQYGLPNISSMIGNSIDNGLAPIDPSYLSEVANNIDAKSFVDRRNVRRTNFNNAVNNITGAITGAISGNPLDIAGAAIGIGSALIGRKGEEATMTSFTEYDAGSDGTGLIGLFGNKRLRRERERIKTNAYSNREAVRGSEYLANRYDMEYGDMNHNTFANGGSTNSLAYVDDGELINTPDGSITAVPEEGKPTDSNLVSLPTGSRILSDKLKVPGSNETFAEAGKKIMKRKKSLSNDIYAQNAAKLNEMNEQQAFDQLYDLQESVKAKRKIKPKSKTVQTFDRGGRVNNGVYELENDNYISTLPDGRTVVRLTGMMNTKGYRNGMPVSYKGKAYNIGRHIGNPFGALQGGGSWYETEPYYNMLPEVIVTPEIQSTVETVTPTTTPYSNQTNKPTAKSTKTISKPVNKSVNTSTAPTITTPPTVDLVMESIQDVQLPELQPAIQRDKKQYADVPEFRTRTNWLGLLPIIDNLTSATPERAGAVYNPYASTILNTMRGRRFDTRAAINDINRNRAVSNYNADQMNTNTGANMAYRIASQRATDDAIQALRTQESNVNNAYLADYANVANNLGQQWVQATNLASDINRRNRAQARNIRRAGLSGLSQWGQNETLMRNQARRDNAMMQLYAPFLQSGFSTEAYNNFINYLGGR